MVVVVIEVNSEKEANCKASIDFVLVDYLHPIVPLSISNLYMISLRRLSTRRCLSSSIKPTAASLLSILRLNRELDLNDAQNESRWMRQSLQSNDETELAKLVERRSRGEPLQYILGKWSLCFRFDALS